MATNTGRSYPLIEGDYCETVDSAGGCGNCVFGWHMEDLGDDMYWEFCECQWDLGEPPFDPEYDTAPEDPAAQIGPAAA